MANRSAILLLTVLALSNLACKPKATAVEEPPSPEAKAYVRNLKLSGVSMKAMESMGGQVLTEIEGNITNAGDRILEQADVACVFYDTYNQLILRERVTIVKKPLKPGETRSFRLPFDSIPQSWNNRMPQMVIARIRLS